MTGLSPNPGINLGQNLSHSPGMGSGDGLSDLGLSGAFGTGRYRITGNSAGLIVSRVITAASSAYSIVFNGSDLAIGTHPQIAAEQGQFSTTLNGSSFIKHSHILAAFTNYASSFIDSSITSGQAIGAEATAYSIVFNASLFNRSFALFADRGEYLSALNSSSVALSRALPSEVGAFSLTLNNSLVSLSRVSVGGAGAFASTFNASTLILNAARSILAERGQMSATFNDSAITASGPQEISFVHTGATFAPILTVTGSPTILWTFADSTTSNSATPNKDFGSAATRTTTLSVTPWTGLTGINIGYDGADGGSPSITNNDQQNVTSVAGLQLAASSLTLWCSSHNPITSVNFANMTALDTVECYQCTSLATADLTNCSAITRLCLEQCDLSAIDISDCTAVEDLRMAAQGGGNQAFDITWGTHNSAWHVCVRDNVLAPLVMSAFPNVQELWIWNTNQSSSNFAPGLTHLTIPGFDDNNYTGVDLSNLFPAGRGAEIGLERNNMTSINIDNCPGISTLRLRDNNLSTSMVDYVLANLDAYGTSNGTLTIYWNSAPTDAGRTSAASLRSRGWTVTVDAGISAAVGAFSSTFNDSSITRQAATSAARGQYSITLNDSDLSLVVVDPTISAELGQYSATFNSSSLTKGLNLLANRKMIFYLLYDSNITAQRTISAERGQYSNTFNDSTITYTSSGPNLSYIGTHVDENATQTRTYSNVSIGTAASDRLVVVCVMAGGGSDAPTSITVGGNSATIHAQGEASYWQNATVASLTVTSGTTATIAVTLGSPDGGPCVISVYTITGLGSTTPQDTDANGGVDPINLQVNVPSGALVIGCAHGGDADAAYTVTGLTADASGVDSFYNYWSGSAVDLAADTTYDVQFSRGNSWSGAAIVVWL